MTEPSQAAATEAATHVYMSETSRMWRMIRNGEISETEWFDSVNETIQAAIARETAALEAERDRLRAELTRYREPRKPYSYECRIAIEELENRFSVENVELVSIEHLVRVAGDPYGYAVKIDKLKRELDKLRADVASWKDTANQAMASEIRLKATLEVVKKYMEDVDMTYYVVNGVPHENEMYGMICDALRAAPTRPQGESQTERR